MSRILGLFLYIACCSFSGQFLFAQSSTTLSYQYDNLNRVVSINYGNGMVVTYTYDQVGNRTACVTTGTAAPDLVLQALSASPTSVAVGGSLTASGTAANTGNAAAAANVVKYYWSANNSFEAATDVLLGSSAVGALAASSTQALSQALTIPAGTAAGSSYLLAIADANAVVTESNEGNNVSAVAITVTATAPVFSCAGAAVLSNGVAVTGSNATGNNAITDYPCTTWNEAGREVVYVYNHTGGNMTVALSNMTVDLDWFALSACDTTNCFAYGDNSTTFAAPAGTYYIVVDGYMGASGTYTLVASSGYPNLVVQTPAVSPTSVTAGGSLSVSATLANVGSFAAVTGSVQCYLSANTTYEATDVLLGTIASNALAANGTQALSGLFNIPSSTAAGAWYVLFRADATNTNTESNETDNLASTALTVTNAPAFSCAGATVLSNGVAVTGSNATGNNAITDYPCISWNEAGREVVYVYNHIGGNMTVALSNMTVDLDWFALSACDTTNCFTYSDNSKTFAAPAGTYYIVVDGFMGASGTYTLVASSGYPNLVVQTPAVSPTSVTAGGSLSVSATLANVGSFASAVGSVQCYLSANTTYEATDVSLGTIASNALAANGTQAISGIVNIPSSTAAGAWYVLFRADATNTNTESNETDNLASAALTVTSGTIDLAPSSFSLSSTTIAKGSYFSTNTNIINNGTGTTGASKFRVYFSTDNVLSTATDILLHTGDNAAIAAGATDNRVYYHTVPTSVTAGTWYAIVVADATNLVTESNETNNTTVLQVTITAPTINCSPATTLSNGVAVTGNNTTGSNTITGYSCLPSWGETGNEVFYSYTHTGGTITATLSGMTTDQDVFILSSCSPASCVLHGDITASGTLAAGTYTIVVDGYQGAAGGFTLTVSSGSADLTWQTASVSPSSVAAGTNVTATSVLQNVGTTVAPATTINYYLSSVPTVNANSVLLGNTSASSISFSTTANYTTTLTIPSTTAAGNWYLLSVADATNVVTESNETNNTGAISLVVTTAATCTAPVISVSATTSSSVTLTWAAISGATNYTIEWSTDGTTFTTQGNTTGTTYQMISLTAGQTYYFRVKTTCSGSVQSVASNTVTAVPTNPPVTLNIGTQMLKNNLTYEEGYFTYVNGKTVFVANDNLTGRELWVTDNTPAGTVLLKDIEAGANGSIINNFTLVGNVLYFTAYTTASGIELWRTDGTAAGTYMVKDIRAGSSGSEPRGLVAHGGYLYFFASDANSRQLWRSDGTSAGTVAVTAISTNIFGEQTFSTGAVMYFAGESTNFTTTELWRTDGTTAGTYLIKDINTAAGGSGMNTTGTYFTVLNSSVTLFVANNGSGQGLWRTDGTAAGTYQVGTGTVGTMSDFRKIVVMNGIAYFSLNNGGDIELWRSDGTTTNTYMVKNINPTGNSIPYNLAVMSNTLLLFTATDGVNGYELWRSDGTSAGTVLVENIAANSSNGIPFGNAGIKSNSRYWVQTESGNFGLGSATLSATDGTTRNVVRVLDCSTEAYIDMSTIANANERVMYLLSKSGVYELWNTCPVTYPAVSNVSGTIGQANTITASNCNTCTWYADNSCGTALATGSSYTTPAITGTTTYYVSNTLNGCESPRIPITISAKTDYIGMDKAVNTLYLSPNPTTTETTLHYSLAESSPVNVTLHNITGKQLNTYNLGTITEGLHEYQLNTSALPKGIYLVTLQTKQRTTTQKLVVQ